MWGLYVLKIEVDHRTSKLLIKNMKCHLFVILYKQQRKDMCIVLHVETVSINILCFCRVWAILKSITPECLSNTSTADWCFKGTRLTINQCFFLVVMYQIERIFFLCSFYTDFESTYIGMKEITHSLILKSNWA